MWNEFRYKDMKFQCEHNIERGTKTPYEYMIEYEKMIKNECYEEAKAITEVLKPLGYNTSDCNNRLGLNN